MSRVERMDPDVLEVLERLRPELRAGGLEVEITAERHRHGFLVYSVYVNQNVREIAGKAEVIEYLQGLRDGIALGGNDPASLLAKAVQAARKEIR